MKWLILSLTVLLSCFNAGSAVLQIDLPYFNLNPVTNRLTTWQAMSPVIGNLNQVYSDANGSIFITNIPLTLINVNVKAPPAATFIQVQMLSTDTGIVNASNRLASGSSSTVPTGQTAWAIATSDTRYQLNGSTASNNFYPLFSNPSNYVNTTLLTAATNAIYAMLPQTNNYTSIVVSNPSSFVTPVSLIDATNRSYSKALADLQATNAVLGSTKQPGNVILTNLSLTGALTNPIVGAGGITLSTNAGVVTITGILTNGFAGTNNVASATNGMNIGTGLMAFQPTNTWATFNYVTNAIAITSNGISTTGISAATATNIFQNGVVGGFVSGVSTNEYLSTAGTNTINSVSKAAQINSGSRRIGGATTTFVGISDNDSQNTMMLGGSGNSATGTAQNSGVLNGQANNLNVGLDSTIIGGTSNNIVSVGLTAFSDFIIGSYGLIQDKVGTFIYSDSSLSNVFSATGDNQFLIRATGGVGIITNNPGTNALLIHGSETINGDLTVIRNIGLNGLPVSYILSTNIVAIFNAGVATAIGTYTNMGAKVYTNIAGNGSSINFQNPSWILQTNQVNLYSASTLSAGSTWVNVIGSTTVPNSSYGYLVNYLGQVLTNFPMNISTGTASSVAGSTNVTIITNGTVYTVAVPTQAFITNGMTSLTYSNPLTMSTIAMLQGGTNLSYLIGQANTNLTYLVGQADSNNVSTVSTTVSNGATRVFFFSSTPSNLVTTTSSSLGFNTNGMLWFNRNGASNNWLVLITTNR